MFSKEFWTAALERAFKTFAQVLGATIVAAGTSLIDTDWVGVLSTAVMATLLSLLTSIGSTTFGVGTNPAAFGPEVIPEHTLPTHREEGQTNWVLLVILALVILIFLVVIGVINVKV